MIGTGSYGQVVQARCKQTEKIVAIKLIKDVLRTDYETIKVLREIQILRHFTEMDPKGNFVTRVLDIYLSEDKKGRTNLFIVQEYLESNLREALDNQEPNEF